ncbi:MAG: S1 RNA-binding domain-containing protein [Clostridiales bacterium]|nr:S1 RNA-binding domain-containing protein [Clostridiales bacterium]
MTSRFLPEGRLLYTPGNTAACATAEGLARAQALGSILEGTALLCDENHDLLVRLGPFTGRIPRTETALGIAEGSTRDIAILSRVGKPVSFTVERLDNKDGVLCPLLSRRHAQAMALEEILSWPPGKVIPATVTHLEPFGAFVDIGCGIPSMIGVDRLSVSRISQPSDRLRVGDEIRAAVLSVDRTLERVTLTHRELLGTWEENAALFRAGMTVPGHVRGIKEYGTFVELTPNLSGLAECREGVREGDRVSVYVKSILPRRMKLKLLIIDILPPEERPEPPRYFITDGVLDRWNYAPEGCWKSGGETVFSK